MLYRIDANGTWHATTIEEIKRQLAAMRKGGKE